MILERRGAFLYKRKEEIRFAINIKRAIKAGIKICHFAPIRAIPQGS